MSTNTGHGHVIPRADGVRARCGGPAMCRICQVEAGKLHAATVSEAELDRQMEGLVVPGTYKSTPHAKYGMTFSTNTQQLPRISDEQRCLLWNLILAHQKSGSDNEAAKQTSRAVDDQVTSMMTAYGRQCAQEAVERQRIDVTAASVQMEPVDGRNLRSAADLGCVPSKTDLHMYNCLHNYKPGGA